MALNDDRQSDFIFENLSPWNDEENHLNTSNLSFGIRCIHLLLIRYIKNQSFKPVNRDNTYLLDKWYERYILTKSSLKNKIDDRFVEITTQLNVNRIEIYIILILYSFHCSLTIRNLCVTIRNDVRLMAFTKSLVLALLEDGSEYISAFPTSKLLYSSNEIVSLRDNINGLSEEPELFLNKLFLNKLSIGDTAHYFEPTCLYSILNNKSNYRIPQRHIEVFNIIQAHLEVSSKTKFSILLAGAHGIGKKTVVQSICQSLELNCIVLNTVLLCTSKLSSYYLLLQEMSMYKGVILIPNAELIFSSPHKTLMLASALQDCQATTILTISARNACPAVFLSVVDHVVELTELTSQEGAQIWESLLPNRLVSVSDFLAIRYRLIPARIQSAFKLASDLAYAEDKKLDLFFLERACNLVQQQSFDGLAVDSVSPSATLSRLVLDIENMKAFKNILSAARAYETVMLEWGFSEHLTTGKGICVLFDGPPGTGKTFAAEVLANELHKPLKRVHMPNLVSKWVGETGENIAKLFNAARTSNAIMLLDEADALISKRTEQASKSTDRYANMEINILLQEIERYDGISILTTNLPKSLDPALERRIQFKISFKTPNMIERKQLWQALIPPQTPIDTCIDFELIARKFELTGGNIKNAVLHAAYAACTDNSIILERHLIEAAENECRKLGLLVRENQYFEGE